MEIRPIAIVLIFLSTYSVYCFEPSERFDRELYFNHPDLGKPSPYRLLWKVTNEDIIFEVHVETLGWFGLGFSPNGGMTGSDIVLGGVSNGQPYLYDRHATGNVMPVYDTKQDYKILSGSENSTHTMLKFQRKLITCDPNDFAITNDTVKLIWALNPLDAQNQDVFNMHTMRGQRSVLLLEKSKAERGTLPKDVFFFDVNVTNVVVPNDYHTLYWCKIVKLPEKSKAHIVKYEPIIQSGHEPFVHHVLIYHCVYNMSEHLGDGEECFNRDHSKTSEKYKCTSRYLAGWAVGAEAVVYPDNLGYPFFEKDASPYMMLEIHYDNSRYVKDIVDNSGMRFYLTETLRPTEIGSIILGMGVSANDIVLPPGQNLLTLSTVCSPLCTINFPLEGLNFIGGFLHEHVHGKAVKVRHIRNNVELPPLLADNHYDFNYQEQRFVNPPRKVFPNDTLIVECDWTTINDQSPIFGGFSTKEEMCFAFLDYYPKSDSMNICTGGPNTETLAKAMGASIRKQTNEIEGPFGKFSSIQNYSLAVNWKDDIVLIDSTLPRTPKGQIFQQAVNTGNYKEFCIRKSKNNFTNPVSWSTYETVKYVSSNVNDEFFEPYFLLYQTMYNFQNNVQSGISPALIALEPTDFSYFDGVSFPQFVPYEKKDYCTNANGQVNNTQRNNISSSNNTILYKGVSGEAVYTNYVILDKNSVYHLYWFFTNDTVTFEIQVKATGWIGLGFSLNGGMAGADIVHIFIDKNGNPQISDRYADINGFPVEDNHQDYELLFAMKNQSHTNAVIRRKRNTCDQHDQPLSGETTRLIYAWSDVVPESKNNFNKHEPSSRGSKSLHLFDPPIIQKEMPADVKHLDITVKDVKIPEDYHTLYWCQIFQLPNWTKHHVIKVEPIIQDGNEMVVHHMLLYACSNSMLQYVGKGEACFDRSGAEFSHTMECTNKYLAGWAVGGETFIYPEEVGLPLFNNDSDKLLLLEMHYDNSNYLIGKTDNSGLRLYLTPELRPIEGGSLTFGTPVGSEFMILPAGQIEFTQYAYCYSDCTHWFPVEGFLAWSGILHTHLAGRKIRLHHIRNGVQLNDIFADDHYDFNYQAAILKPKPIQILPGDEFIVECVYETKSRNETTYGGFSTRQEMCLLFLSVYPRPEVGEFTCTSFPSYGDSGWSSLFKANYSANGSVFVMADGTNKTAKQFVETEVKFPNQSVIDKFQQHVQFGQQITFCQTKPRNSTAANIIAKYDMIFGNGPPKIEKTLKYDNPCGETIKNTTNATTENYYYQGSNEELYARYIALDKNGLYHLYWRFDETNITFEIQAKAKGWVGLGFSPNGGMANADIVHAYVDDKGASYLTDRFATANGYPVKDKQQDYTLLRASKNDTHIIVKFTRKRFTCDEQDMLLLMEDTLRIIYAWSDVIPESENSFVMHLPTSRGTKSVHLFDPPLNVKLLPDNVERLDITVKDVKIPDDYHTLYWCQIIALPNYSKRHLIRVDPIIQDGNEMNVHHIILYGCGDEMAEYAGRGESCFDKNEDEIPMMKGCQQSFLAGWAVGSEGTVFPDDVGLPMFDNHTHKYVMLEMHYDNSNYLKGKVDNSGVRLFLTQNIRPVESGSMVFGAAVGPQFMILPSGQAEFVHYTYCYSDCTHWFPNEGIKVWAATPHTHLAGRKVRIHHVRDGKQLDDIYADENYDFNYQQSFIMPKPIVILPNDEFIVECVYDTRSRNETTYGGYSTKNEMCLMFLEVYPRLQVGEFTCTSFPSYGGNEWKNLFNANYDQEKDVFIMADGTNKTAKEFAKTEVKFASQNEIDKFQRNIRDGTQIEFCQTRKRNSSASTPIQYDMVVRQGSPKVTEVWKRPKICSNNNNTEKSATEKPSNPITNGQQNNTDKDTFTHMAILDTKGLFVLKWAFDETNITFQVEAATKGWFGLGFSPNGDMTNADIAHVFVDNNGKPELTDRFAKANGYPDEDTHSDYSLISCLKNESHITAVITRNRNTCDNEDFPLNGGTTRVIYAWSDIVPTNKNSFLMHEVASRGAKSLRLLDKPLTFIPLPTDVKNLDVVVSNVKIPEDYETLYWCQIFMLPQWNKHHIIRIDPKIQTGNEMIVHHLLLYSCSDDMSKHVGNGEPCFDRSGMNFSETLRCSKKYIAGWAVGGESTVYPDDVGLPMFDENGDKFVLIEIHYDNSNKLKDKVDSSGFRLFMTPTFRPIEAGSITFGNGMIGSQFLILPPGQKEFTHYTYCYAECTQSFPSDGFNIWSGLLHTHLTGRKIRLHHIRNGTQLEDIFSDEHYDFNFQASVLKSKPVKILPNDEFIVECVYDTTSRTDITFGGFGTKQEMCLLYLDIYPRPKAGALLCLSYPSYGSSEWKTLFNASYNAKDDVFQLSNGTISPKQFAETQIKFADQNVVDKFQKSVRDGLQILACNKNEQTEGYFENLNRTGPPEIKFDYKAQNYCMLGSPIQQSSQPTVIINSSTYLMTTTTVSNKPAALAPLAATTPKGGTCNTIPLRTFDLSIIALTFFLFVFVIT